MFKQFLMKKMMKSQMKNLPQDQQDKVMKAIEENPELFDKIGKEIEEEVKKGKDKQQAAMSVMLKHQKELQNLMG